MTKFKITIVFALFLILGACASSGPATTFYSLFPAENLSAESAGNKSGKSIGVALVRLPGYLDSPAIVSKATTQRINISGYHAWAEPLDEAATRTVAGDLRALLPESDIQAYPWDMRTQPEVVLRLEFSEFEGVRGERAALQTRWSLYSNKDKKQIATGFFEKELALASNSYQDYVTGLNALINELSVAVASEIAKN